MTLGPRTRGRQTAEGRKLYRARGRLPCQVPLAVLRPFCVGDVAQTKVKSARIPTFSERTVQNNSASSRSATLLGVGAIFLWCWSGVCLRTGAKAIGPMAYLALIAAFGAATVVLLRLFQGKPIAPLVQLPGRVVVAGFLGIALYEVLLAMAFGIADEKDVGQVNLLNYLWPIWIVVLGLGLLSEKVRLAPAMTGAALGLAGIAVAGGPQTLAHPPSNILPHCMALGGGALWAVYSVLLRRWRVSEQQSGVPLHFTACAVMAATIAAVRGEWESATRADWTAVFWVLFGGIGRTGLGYYWWEIGMKRGAVPLLASLAYTIPIGSSILIGLFFREAMNPGLLPGAVLIAAGAYLAHRAVH